MSKKTLLAVAIATAVAWFLMRKKKPCACERNAETSTYQSPLVQPMATQGLQTLQPKIPQSAMLSITATLPRPSSLFDKLQVAGLN